MEAPGGRPGLGGIPGPGSAVTEISVTHILPGTGFGGTEFVVLRLARAERSRGLDSRVVSLKPEGPLGDRFREAGVPFRRWDWKRLLPQTPPEAGGVRRERPFEIFNGWLYAGNLMALLAARRGSGLVWNLMQANLSPAVNRPFTRIAMRLGALLSARGPDKIVCNSATAQEAHRRCGYAETKMTVIPNGVDASLFHPRPGERERLGQRLGIPPKEIRVGHLARWDPQKDHRTFVRAAGRLLAGGARARFLLAGPNITPDNAALVRWIQDTGFPLNFHLLGAVEDAERVLALNGGNAPLDLMRDARANVYFESGVRHLAALDLPLARADLAEALRAPRFWARALGPWLATWGGEALGSSAGGCSSMDVALASGFRAGRPGTRERSGGAPGTGEGGNMKVLVTGAGGVIGSHVVEELLRHGHRVRALVHYNALGHRGHLEEIASRRRADLEIVAGDVTDGPQTLSLVKTCGGVLHLAALIAIPYSYCAGASFVVANVQGTLNVLEACRRSGVRRLVVTSTSEVYGSARRTPMDEHHPLQAQSPYAATKIAADQLALSYHRSHGLPVVVLRPFNTYGPRQSARASPDDPFADSFGGENPEAGEFGAPARPHVCHRHLRGVSGRHRMPRD